MLKEYIVILKREVFRVYAYTEDEAKEVLSNACVVYREAKRKQHTEYWDNIQSLIYTEHCEIIENTDFIGVRKIN